MYNKCNHCKEYPISGISLPTNGERLHSTRLVVHHYCALVHLSSLTTPKKQLVSNETTLILKVDFLFPETKAQKVYDTKKY